MNAASSTLKVRVKNWSGPPDAGGGQRDQDVATTALRHAFRQMLTRLCAVTEVPVADRAAVIDSASLHVRDVPVAFQLEAWSGFVKVYIDVGKPSAEAAPDLYRYLLEHQMFLPAPFSMVPCVHPESKHVVLYACAPLPVEDAADRSFLEFLNACVTVAETLRIERADLEM